VKLLLLDGNSLTYRAFYALPTDMATASGQVTNAVFGFTSMFAYLLKDQQPDGVMVAFDRPEPTFRHEANPQYKAQREAAPDILRQQMGLVREVLDALRVHVVELAGWEADDILATSPNRPRPRATRSSSSPATATATNSSRTLGEGALQPPRGQRLRALRRGRHQGEDRRDPGAVHAVRGVAWRSQRQPRRCSGCREKTAAKLINTYGDLDGIFANVDAQTPKLRSSLAEHEQRVRENATLMVLRRNAPIEVDLTNLTVEPDVEAARKLFDFLEFRALTDRLFEAIGTSDEHHPSSEGEVLEAEITDLADPVSAVALLSRCRCSMSSARGPANPAVAT
jgi:DNA polymerase-1